MTTAYGLYGRSLYDLAKEEGISEEIFSDMKAVSDLFSAQPDYTVLLSEPSIPKQERLSLLDKAFEGQIQPYLLNFLKILTERGMIRGFGYCLSEYSSCYNKDHGITEAYVTTAVQMKPSELEELKERLEKLSKKKVSIKEKIDPELLGGILVEMDGKTYDGTLAGRLSVLKKNVKDIVL